MAKWGWLAGGWLARMVCRLFGQDEFALAGDLQLVINTVMLDPQAVASGQQCVAADTLFGAGFRFVIAGRGIALFCLGIFTHSLLVCFYFN